jgi:hypothetical protein
MLSKKARRTPRILIPTDCDRWEEAGMMGRQERQQGQLFYEFNLDDVIPKDHLLRRMNVFVTAALADLHQQLRPFYSDIGRPSIDPELMIRMLIVGYCYGIRHERRLCEEVKLNLAYRWFCRLDLDDKVPHHSTSDARCPADVFKGRGRLLSSRRERTMERRADGSESCDLRGEAAANAATRLRRLGAARHAAAVILGSNKDLVVFLASSRLTNSALIPLPSRPTLERRSCGQLLPSGALALARWRRDR